MTLDKIKNHPQFPFVNFQKNNIDFLMLELYWVELFSDILGENIVKSWKPELVADQEDGNPIFVVANRNNNVPRIIRVIQRFNIRALPELNLNTLDTIYFTDDAFVPYAPDISRGATDFDMLTQVDELVISSTVSDDCEKIFREHIKLWCVDLVSLDTMLGYVNDYWKKVNSKLIQNLE